MIKVTKSYCVTESHTPHSWDYPVCCLHRPYQLQKIRKTISLVVIHILQFTFKNVTDILWESYAICPCTEFATYVCLFTFELLHGEGELVISVGGENVPDDVGRDAGAVHPLSLLKHLLHVILITKWTKCCMKERQKVAEMYQMLTTFVWSLA